MTMTTMIIIHLRMLREIDMMCEI